MGCWRKTTAQPLAQHRSLVLGDGTLNLQQQLVVRVFGDGVLEKDDGATRAAQLLQQDHLVSILAGEAVGTQHDDEVELTVMRRIPQCVQSGAVEARTAVTFVFEDVVWRQQVVAVLSHIRFEGSEL